MRHLTTFLELVGCIGLLICLALIDPRLAGVVFFAGCIALGVFLGGDE